MKRAKFGGFDSGWVPDVPGYDLPPGMWSDVSNVRFRDGAIEKIAGYDRVLPELSATAIWATCVADAAAAYWVYASNTVMYATDGASTNDITGTLSLSATDDLGYTGGAFHGHLVVSDGVSIPQSWTPGLANNLVSLTAWPAITCEVIRPWRDFLVAMRIKEGGDTNSRLMRWSDVAAKGSLPLSWDYTDPTNQSGIKEFGETQDGLVDCAGLRDSLIIYKQNATWVADYVGGADVLGFRQLFSQAGLLTQDCIGQTPAGHVLMTGDDIVFHDGNSATSLIDRRMRRWFFGKIDTTNYKRSFVVMNPRDREAMFCVPEAGFSHATMALVWNWAENKMYPFYLGERMACAATGPTSGTPTTFDGDSSIFDTGIDTFDFELASPWRQNVQLFSAVNRNAYQFGASNGYYTAPMQCSARRYGHPVTDDLGTIKRIWRITPKVEGTIGETIRFKVSVRDSLSHPANFATQADFTIGVDQWIDLRLDGRVIDLGFEYYGWGAPRLYGFDVEYEDSGLR